MNVFLPYSDFGACVRALDNRRLGKQRVECKQIALAILRREGRLEDSKKGWMNHPAVRVWQGHLSDLFHYYLAARDEWCRRGFKHEMTWEIVGSPMSDTPITVGVEAQVFYRRLLFTKNPTYYAQWEKFGTLDEGERSRIWDVLLRDN